MGASNTNHAMLAKWLILGSIAVGLASFAAPNLEIYTTPISVVMLLAGFQILSQRWDCPQVFRLFVVSSVFAVIGSMVMFYEIARVNGVMQNLSQIMVAVMWLLMMASGWFQWLALKQLGVVLDDIHLERSGRIQMIGIALAPMVIGIPVMILGAFYMVYRIWIAKVD